MAGGGSWSITNSTTSVDRAQDGQPNGGAGGNGNCWTTSTNPYARGGVGNPGGQCQEKKALVAARGSNGTGGLLVIYANTLNNNSNSAIKSCGVKNREGAYASDYTVDANGGSSGGGSINIFYTININNNGNISANGGAGALGWNSSSTYNSEKYHSGAGGDGAVTYTRLYKNSSNIEAHYSKYEDRINPTIGKSSNLAWNNSMLGYISSDDVKYSGIYNTIIDDISYDFEVVYLTPSNCSQYNATYDAGTNTYTVGDLNLGTANQYRTAVLKCDGNLNITGKVTTSTYRINQTHKTGSINSSYPSQSGTTSGEVTNIKGMFIYCSGTLTNNGDISMTARGTYEHEGENVYLWKDFYNKYSYVPKVGGTAGPGNKVSGGGLNYANAPATTDRKTGGGGRRRYSIL